jgi:hypothetical protein
MSLFRDPNEGQWERNAATFALGALGGLTLGVLVSRLLPNESGGDGEFGQRARGFVRRLQPARLRRLGFEQDDLDRLENSVLNAFLVDSVLSERGVDIGAISPGIIELSGSVRTEEEAQRAVRLASRIAGVRTVVNRIDVEELSRRAGGFEVDDSGGRGFLQEGRVGGMGRRRQSIMTDPDRPDDSQQRKEEALAAADRDQWSDEGLASGVSRTDSRPEVQSSNRTNFREDELDNQDPHGKHRAETLDDQPQELRSESRVGEEMKPGTRLRLERSDLSLDGPIPRDRDD